MKRWICLLTTAALLLACVQSVSAADLPDVSAACACVVERQTGRLIAGKNEHKRASMASTTKIMTALILCETADLDATAVISEEMVRVEGSSMGLLAGDTVHYRDLLYGMMLASGNDAANATAILLAGSQAAFAEKMNARAALIGMTDTHFVTPSGLDDEAHYSTAYDMALLAVEALKNPDFAAAVSSKSATLCYGNPPYRRTLTNHNRLLAAFSLCDGVKTGFTKKSGRCLVTSAKEGDKGVVAVTLNAPNDWEDHKTLLRFGLDRLESREVAPPDLSNRPVVGGQRPARLSVSAVTLALLPDDFDRLTAEVELAPTLFAPLASGEEVGRVRWKLADTIVAEAAITVVEEVKNNKSKRTLSLWDWIRALIGSQ